MVADGGNDGGAYPLKLFWIVATRGGIAKRRRQHNFVLSLFAHVGESFQRGRSVAFDGWNI